MEGLFERKFCFCYLIFFIFFFEFICKFVSGREREKVNIYYIKVYFMFLLMRFGKGSILGN